MGWRKEDRERNALTMNYLLFAPYHGSYSPNEISEKCEYWQELDHHMKEENCPSYGWRREVIAFPLSLVIGCLHTYFFFLI